jgi:hypothetical protein
MTVGGRFPNLLANAVRTRFSTQRRKDATIPRSGKIQFIPHKPHFPPAPEMVERSAPFASLRLCVEKIDRHGGRGPAPMAQAAVPAGLPEIPAFAGMTICHRRPGEAAIPPFYVVPLRLRAASRTPGDATPAKKARPPGRVQDRHRLPCP